jgi:hypothetical protein
LRSNRFTNLLPIILVLLVFSAAVFALQVYLFRDQRDTGFYLLQDLAFLPLQVLLVTLVLNEMFTRREKTDRMNKMNMVIGAFVFDIGIPLLKALAPFDRNGKELSSQLLLTRHWGNPELEKALDLARKHKFNLDCGAGNLSQLKGFLAEKRDSMLQLLGNPNLLEHETFTDLLWAVNHLTDELLYRETVDNLSEPDAVHLSEDIKRALTLLITGWLNYLNHIRKDYPFLFSLVVRTNPFNPEAKVEITKEALEDGSSK